MVKINEYLRNLNVENLMEISSISESITFDEKSIVRQLINEYKISQDFHTGLIGLRNSILVEITRRYFGKLKNNIQI